MNPSCLSGWRAWPARCAWQAATRGTTPHCLRNRGAQGACQGGDPDPQLRLLPDSALRGIRRRHMRRIFQPAAFPAVHPVRRKRRQRESGQQRRLLLRVPAEYRQLTPENKGRGSLRPLPAFICFFPAPAGTAFCPARRCSRPIVRRPPRPGGRGSRWAADFARWRRLPPGRPGDSPCGRPAGRR